MSVKLKVSLPSHLHDRIVILHHTSVSVVAGHCLEPRRIKALGYLEMKRDNIKLWAEFFVTLQKKIKGEHILCLDTKPQSVMWRPRVKLDRCARLASCSVRSTLD